MGEGSASRPNAGDERAHQSQADAVRAMWNEYAFLLRHGLAEDVLWRAIAEALRRGSLPHLVLIGERHIEAQRYIALLQAEIDAQPGIPGAFHFSEIIDPVSVGPLTVSAAAMRARARGAAPLIMPTTEVDWLEPQATSAARARQAANGLLERAPEHSAAARIASWQLVMAVAMIGLPIGGLLVVPEHAIPMIAVVLTLPFLLIVGLRVACLLAVLPEPAARREPPRAVDADLPVYSILVPLYREADVLPGLVASLGRLDYPPERLDILLILESIDQQTQAAARALHLPGHFRIVVVPDQAPRTKPKALNYALGLARGKYIVVYDAEDDPEPEQLRRALAAFRRRPRTLMCVQARLAIEDSSAGFLERQFALEYVTLFGELLPALVRLRLPVPLGGTSNHFPRAALERLGGWDAHNVTEDADLGIRIARLGGRIETLASTTTEEAPATLGVWMRQRTRWLKGYMMTWLVHMRRPGLLLCELGPGGFVGFNAFLGGIVLSALVHPIFFAWLGYAAATGQLPSWPETAAGGVLVWLWLFNLAVGYASIMAMAALAVSRRGLLHLLPHVLLMPLYWLLISAAAYRAAVQLVVNPYLWEKTPHSARLAAGRRRR